MTYYVGHIAPLVKAAGTDAGRVLLLGGAPGTGKTAFAHWLASQVGGVVLSLLCHAWSSDEDLFAGVNLPALVAGDADGVVEPGLLRRAAALSLQGTRAVLLIDELDKAPARFEALLLGFLERWEVPVAPGIVETADASQLWVVMTHNEMRPVSEPLQRRAFRYRMPFLPEQVEISLLGGGQIAARLVRLANDMRRNEALSSPSLSELARLRELLPLADSLEEARYFLVGCLAKTAADEAFLSARANAFASTKERAG